MILLDNLRPPSLLDPSAAGYKDWLHLNVFDHENGNIGLVNVSLHGSPSDPRSRAIGLALLNSPETGWRGDIEIGGFADAAIGFESICLEQVAMAVQPGAGMVMASVRNARSELRANLKATALAPPIIVEEQLPLGNGWISWLAVPRLKIEGNLIVGTDRIVLKGASAYHDHNWGRWHWGQNLGWQWGCFITAGPSRVAFVLSRTADRAHRRFGKSLLIVQLEHKRRTFAGGAVKLGCEGTLSISRRLPGALAALHQDKAHVHLPNMLKFTANDGIDRVELLFSARSAAQLIVADPVVKGYGFIHEIVGEFICSGNIDETTVTGSGLGVLELVY
jgi:hypothetical protein